MRWAGQGACLAWAQTSGPQSCRWHGEELAGPGGTGHSRDGCSLLMHVPQSWEHTHKQALHITPKGKQTPRGGQAGLEPGHGRAQPLSPRPSACSYSPCSPIPMVGLSPVPTVTKCSSPESEEVSQEDSVVLYLLAQGLLGKFLDCSVP